MFHCWPSGCQGLYDNCSQPLHVITARCRCSSMVCSCFCCCSMAALALRSSASAADLSACSSFSTCSTSTYSNEDLLQCAMSLRENLVAGMISRAHMSDRARTCKNRSQHQWRMTQSRQSCARHARMLKRFIHSFEELQFGQKLHACYCPSLVFN